jgi:hypothetical protein
MAAGAPASEETLEEDVGEADEEHVVQKIRILAWISPLSGG